MAHQWHTVHYTAAATLAAAALFYVFGPTLLPDHDAETRPRKGAVGLSNSANDCYICSVLQALAGSPKFLRFLREQTALDRQHGTDDAGPVSRAESPSDDASSHSTSSVSTSLHDILDKLHDPALNGTTISPRYFIAFIEYALGTYLGRQQQDAQELLQVLAERIATETSKWEKRLQDVDPDAQTPPFPLEGVLESQIECQTCQYQPTPKRTSFNMLSLTVPHQWSASLDDCFDDLLKQEVIDDYKCDRCRLEHAANVKKWRFQREKSDSAREQLQTELEEMARALETDPSAFADVQLDLAQTEAPSRRITRANRITSFPPVLVVHLSRSIYTGSGASKNKCNITFSEKLRLGGLRERHVYRLMSVVTHRGSHNSGHYETFRRQAHDGALRIPAAPSSSEKPALEDPPSPEHDEKQAAAQNAEVTLPSYQADKHKSRLRKSATDDKWWGISDAHVRECRTKDVLSSKETVYLLFYEKTR